MGILAPITDFVDKSTLEQYIPMTVEAATYKGEVYQLPLSDVYKRQHLGFQPLDNRLA